MFELRRSLQKKVRYCYVIMIFELNEDVNLQGESEDQKGILGTAII